MENKIEEFKSGARYLKLQKDYHRVAAGYIKEIGRLKEELADAHKQTASVRNLWTEECYTIYDEYRTEPGKKEETIRSLEEKIWAEQGKNDETLAKTAMEYEERIREKDSTICRPKNELAHAQALLGRNSTNTGTPTS